MQDNSMAFILRNFTKRQFQYNCRLIGIANNLFMPFLLKDQTEIIDITEYTDYRYGACS